MFRKGIAAKLLNKKKEAKGYFNELLKINVQDIDMLYDMGLQLNQLNESKSAQQCFKSISNNSNYDENNIYLLYKKAMAEYLLQNIDEAMKYFEKILNKIKDIKDTKFLTDLGNAMVKLRKKEQAITCFKGILDVDSDMECDYANKGIAYIVLQKLEEQDNKKDDFKPDSQRNYWSVIKKYSEKLKNDNGNIDYEKLQEKIFTYNVFSPFISDFLDKKGNSNDKKDNSNDEHLYYYTSINGLKGILENKELWVTKSEFLNDPTEISYIKDVVDNVKYKKINNIEIKKISKKINEFYDKKYRKNDNNKKDVYVLSMSAEKDSLPMWRNYSEGDGYNIQFNKRSLKSKFMEPQSYIPHTYGKVKYIDKKDKKGFIYDLIKSIYESAEKCNVKKDENYENIVIETILANIRMIALFVKHTGFEYENEYRFVFIPDFWKCNNVSSYSIQQDTKLNRDGNADENQNKNRSYTNENIEYDFRPSKGILIPFIKISIDKNNNEPLIEKIFTSPTSDEILTKQGIEDFYKLKYGDTKKIDVQKSDIPLRDI